MRRERNTSKTLLLVVLCSTPLMLGMHRFYRTSQALRTMIPGTSIHKNPTNVAVGREIADDERINVSSGSFGPEELAWQEQAAVPCGYHKCFFRSKTSPRLGYLVMRASLSPQAESNRLAELEAAWNYAKQLEQEFGVQQFLLGPPLKIKPSHELLDILNHGLVWAANPDLPIATIADKFADNGFYKEGSSVYVQPSRVAPEPNIIIGNAPLKINDLRRSLDGFLQSVDASDKKSFARLFVEQIELSRNIITEEQCLMEDFQVLLDTKGHLYHLDMDRCLTTINATVVKRTASPEMRESCLNFLDKLETYVQQVMLNERKASHHNSTFNEANYPWQPAESHSTFGK